MTPSLGNSCGALNKKAQKMLHFSCWQLTYMYRILVRKFLQGDGRKSAKFGLKSPLWLSAFQTEQRIRNLK